MRRNTGGELGDFTSRSARFGAQRRRKRRLQTVLTIATSVVLIAALAAGYYVFELTRKFNDRSGTVAISFTEEQEHARPVKHPDDKSLNMLLLGVDSSGDQAVGTDPFSGPLDQRSDSMMLVHIPEDREEIFVMSMVRDTWVEIPGYGQNKLNSAITFGGVPLLMQTVEGLFETKVDHVAMIDFDGFRELSTALGGVTVHNDLPFTAHDTDYFYPAGAVRLEGDRALRFVRERKSFVDGDYQRVKNQRKFIAAAVDQMLAPGTLTNPAKIYEVVDKVLPYLNFDQNLDASTIVGLALELKNIGSSDIKMFTMPTAGSATSYDGQAIELASELAIAEISAALQSDTMTDYVKNSLPPE